MTPVEVLAPLRLETRFVPPADGRAQWLLRVRIYPDEFSVRRTVAPPTPAELDRLADAVQAMTAHAISTEPPLDEAAAFRSFAATVGARRALGLWRSSVADDGAGGRSVDRSRQAEHVSFQVHGPAGLPEQLDLWLVHADGTRERRAVLALDLAAIGADLDLAVFDDAARLATGTLPETWWLSYRRAVEVGLGVDLEVGPVPPVLEALVVVGTGTSPAGDLVDEHSAGGRLAVLAPGTPTNTVAGEPTTDLGDDAHSLVPLLHVDPTDQMSTTAVLRALTGRVPGTALPMLGGARDHVAPGALPVQGLWPVLWGRSLRDVTGAGAAEVDAAGWAIRHLAVEGPLPAFRVGDQPYGLLPTTAFASWLPEPGDPSTDVEDRILRWALPWRAGAAAAARSAGERVQGADTRGLLGVLGSHAPSRHWQVRPVADRALIEAWRAAMGLPPLPASAWDRSTAAAWREVPYPQAAIGPAARPGVVPGPPEDELEDPELLRELVRMEPEPLYFGRVEPLGLVGHLFREAMIAQRAVLGEAVQRWREGLPVVLDQPLPLDDEGAYVGHVLQGGALAIEELEGSGDEAARLLVERFRRVEEALMLMADLWDELSAQLFRGTLAALDTASSRVDPWLTGVAHRRLQRMTEEGAPFLLGAYGWVDAPAAFDGALDALAPGPTAAGLLHAPSPEQALTAALLRDAAVRYPGEDRWQLTIDSAKVRASVALAERVRLGVHPFEALGLEVEKAAGEWDTVRLLREHYPLAPDQQQRRVCDGAQVLRAAREGTLVAGLPGDLPGRLAPLDDVLDTYADLLVADGVHALVTGRADLAGAAMEAAAGFGPPPELRAIRTPRAAGTVRVAAWAVLPAGPAPAAAADPVEVADPAFAALVASELPAGAAQDDVDRLAVVLGGGDDEAPSPSLTGGPYDGLIGSADAALRTAVLSDLSDRLVRLAVLAEVERDGVALLDVSAPGAAAALERAAARWRVDLTAVVPSDPELDQPTAADLQAALTTTLTERHAASTEGLEDGVTEGAVNARRRALRALVGRPGLPVLPVFDAGLLPALQPVPELDRTWLEVVAAVRPRLSALEAHQFGASPWGAAVAAPGGSADPWHPTGPVLVVYGPEPVHAAAGPVAVAVLDAWTDSVPSRRHATTAAFGFNAPKSRAPQAVLLAVPPDPAVRLADDGLLDVVLETRELVHARAARPGDVAGLPYATPAPLVHAEVDGALNFMLGWPG